ncbi:eukaryotic translation initiation factor 5B [Scaptodrosophila lebanonensis]|uniref:Eukaryotic translation initiation factor 5B n=1 Tax=Drosophila lebanonensis TaxID=7225 RepID=A0A6J2UD17_DROLE|nr:eukaryotic translation initiation factor 5B [Scaptodrosophila lebanonensis]
MVKAKKGKKEIVTTAGGGSSADEIESNPAQSQTVIDSDADSVDVDKVSANNKRNQQQKGKKQKNKRATAPDSDEGSDADQVEALTKGVKKLNVKGKGKKAKEVASDDESGDEAPAPKSKGKAAKKSAFELLMDDDDDDDDEAPAEEIAPVDNEDEEEVVVTKTQKKNEKKGKKGKRKGKDDDEEDLDKVLAELQAEYAGEAPSVVTVVSPEDLADEEFSKKKKNKKQQKQTSAAAEEAAVEGSDDEIGNEEAGGTMKTAAQKKKEKKERQKREAALAKQRVALEPKQKPVEKPEPAPEPAPVSEEPAVEDDAEPVANEGDETEDGGKASGKNKKKGKKDKKAEAEEEKKDTKKKGMSAAMVAAMQEQLKKRKEEEARLQQLEEERIRLEEEREEARLEAVRLEAEKKEKKKQKEAERKARLKAEGKLLTKKQKEDRARAQALLESLKAQGLEIPDPTERRAPRPGTRIRPNKKKGPKDGTTEDEEAKAAAGKETPQTAAEQAIAEAAKQEAVKESWDATDSEAEPEDESSQATTTTTNNGKAELADETESEENDSDDESESEDEESEEESEKEEQALANDPESRRLRAEARILKRQAEAEKKRTTDELRASVVCVLGHVDTGKTKILDKLRRTHVQDSEAGGITQQIGATNVPIDAIKEQTKYVRGATGFDHRLPGLLIIDTPGHESFSNLRNRGSSLCDIAILVVDIMHGLEPQTIESINLLKKKKCPFIVALNKIDRLYDWKVLARRDVRDVVKEQQANTQLEFQQRTKEVILQFAEQGLNAALYYENTDPKTYISLVPTSAITGEGMGNLLFMIVDFCQKMLAKRLMYSEELQATVLEVKAIPGLGTTIDAILINGKLREGQTMILAGTDGPITTQIRSLLMPQPMKELRVKNAYVEYKEVKAAQGVKIAAKDLEKAIAGINLLIAHKPDEIEICREEVARELKSALSHIKLAQAGVYVQASTLGSLEALLEFLRTSKIPYSAIRIGPVVKRDVMKASTMLEHEAQYATILAFDVKVEKEAQEMADSLGVKIFQADIIYHLFDKFTSYREELKQKKREEFRSIAVFPCKLKILPQFIFNSRDPIVMGVMVENGIVKVGTPMCVPSKEFVDIGIVTSIESNHKQIEFARKGQEICVKIEPIPGESPKMFGRHFEADDMLVSKISRQSIDACKDYFRDDLIKADWALMVELKKLFEIL